VIHSRRSNPFDNKKDDICIDSLKNKLHLSLNTDNQDHDQYKGQGHHIGQFKEHSGQSVIADQGKIFIEREGT